MTIADYQTLYNNSGTFGVRKAEEASLKLEDTLVKLRNAKQRNKDLRAKVLELGSKLDVVEMKETAKTESMSMGYFNQIVQLKNQIETLEAFLSK